MKITEKADNMYFTGYDPVKLLMTAMTTLGYRLEFGGLNLWMVENINAGTQI